MDLRDDGTVMPTEGKLKSRQLRSRVLALTVLLLAFLVVPVDGASAASSPRWGVVLSEQPTLAQSKEIARGGVTAVRFPIAWAAIQPLPGVTPNWSSVDTIVRNADEAGLEVLPFLVSPPSWAGPSEGIGGGGEAPRNLPVRTPAQRSGWAEFLTLLVQRYGHRGSFWTENPELPAHPIELWQIWNEENFKYFIARPNPKEYSELVEESYAAIAQSDPHARILLGGLFAWPKEAASKVRPRRAYFGAEFLEQMYEAAPGVKNDFVGVALHPYSYHYQQLTRQVTEFRNVMQSHGDGGKGLWITEMSWSSGHPSTANGNNGFEKGPAGQARELRGAFGLLRANAATWRIRQVFWFSLTDAPGTCNFCDGSGLFTQAFRPKPAWHAFESQARG